MFLGINSLHLEACMGCRFYGERTCNRHDINVCKVVKFLIKILIILGPFLTIEYFCLITEINTAPAGSSFQGHYDKGL